MSFPILTYHQRLAQFPVDLIPSPLVTLDNVSFNSTEFQNHVMMKKIMLVLILAKANATFLPNLN